MAEGRKPALRLSGISKAYGRTAALRDLSFEVAEGCFFALFGPSSVGKTTALRTIAGLVRPDRGRLEIGGVEATNAPIAGRGVSMVFQSFALYPHLTVAENFAYPLREQRLGKAVIEARVRETATMLKLGHRLGQKPATLSGGEQQRVALGRSLIQRPRILLLDEPLTNLDAKLRHDMRAEFKRLHRLLGMTVVYATPDELEALAMGEEIAVMRDGTVVQRGTPDELYERPADLYVASKIGSPAINVVEVRLGNGNRLDTPFGPIGLPRPANGASGEAAMLGIRPSDLRASRPGEAGVAARVHLVEPLGDVTIVALESANHMLRLVLSEQQAANLKPGDPFTVAIDPGKIHVFRAHDGQAMR
ncbi:MAG: ABC transporter ATP-binding protein [Alphaproteobacteria bacterium]|nr:ABC transporter ATP-binding protein [Alphaproteobacteria bacterium]